MPPTPRIDAFLLRLSGALETQRVRITWKADEELVNLGWSRKGALDQLALLSATDATFVVSFHAARGDPWS